MIRTSLFLSLLVLSSACRVVNEDAEEERNTLDGRWRGGASWIELEIQLSAGEDVITGSGFITGNPVEGTWETDEVSIELSTTNNGSVSGTWNAGSSSGTLGGIMTYPLISASLRRPGEPTAAGRMVGRIQEDDAYTLRSNFILDNDTTSLDFRHKGKLPVVPIEISGNIRGEQIYLQLGTAFAFGGTMSDRVIAGVIEAANVDSYQLFLNRISSD